MKNALLRVDGLCVRFGRDDVVRDVSLEVGAGAIVALLGVNGAGKSVTARAVSGALAARSGTVAIAGRDVTGSPPEVRVRLGLRHLPQVGGVVPELTVAENLRLGGHVVRRRGGGLYQEVLADVLERFPFFATSDNRPAGTLSAGRQRMLALAVALMAAPRVLVADEPSAGLAPGALDAVTQVLDGLRRCEVGVLLVEQNLELARSLADEVIVLERGAVAYREQAARLDDRRLAALFGLVPPEPPRPPG